ncbi:hypothetical protein [Clostridium thermobutyricum]|uniref:hypothetical protein n=1 Tax=Clostridium thermobutyricum TaxID=29372 RepID=UPI0018A9C3E3|nr:hypothetical protein [Clostridium thermobutyricum]
MLEVDLKIKKSNNVELINSKNKKVLIVKDGFDWATLIFGLAGLGFLPSLLRGEFFISFIIATVQYIVLIPGVLYILGGRALLPLIDLLVIIGIIFIIYRSKVNGKRRIKRLEANGYIIKK